MEKYKLKLESAIYESSGKFYIGGKVLEEVLKEYHSDQLKQMQETEYEPYFGWCDVEGCKNEGANGGGCWRETGYWTVCDIHSAEYRAGKPQPKMKQSAIEKEKMRGADGILRQPKEKFCDHKRAIPVKAVKCSKCGKVMETKW